MKKSNTLFITIFLIIGYCNNSHAVVQEQNPTNINTVESLSLHSKILQEKREFWVKLPEQYYSNKNENYPVIYILDGVSLQENIITVYNNYWGHFMPHCILVGIRNQNTRKRDLTLSSSDTPATWSPDQKTGGAEKFTEFIASELIPYIDSNYKSSPYRTLIGHSYAGLFTINAFLNHTQLFTNYLAIDPSLHWADQKLVKLAETKLKTGNFKGKSLFMSMASEQLHIFDETVTFENVSKDKTEFTLFSRSILSFSQLAMDNSANGLNFKFQNYPEDLHGTVPLPSMIDGLTFLFEWFQFKSPQKYNNPETTISEIKDLLATQASIYKSHLGYEVPPMVEEMLNGYGYMNLQMGHPDKAKMFFELAIKYYPESANSYDSMADYYQSMNDTKNAITNVKKAYDISQSEYHKTKLIQLQKE